MGELSLNNLCAITAAILSQQYINKTRIMNTCSQVLSASPSLEIKTKVHLEREPATLELGKSNQNTAIFVLEGTCQFQYGDINPH